MDKTRGRPPKTLGGEEFQKLLTELAGRGTFAQACAQAGTSTHVVKKAMREMPAIDFEIRVACLTRGRKRLCDGAADPALLYVAGKEAEAIDAGEKRRDWSEIEAAIRRRQEMSASFAEARARAGAQIVIPEARTPEEENF